MGLFGGCLFLFYSVLFSGFFFWLVFFWGGGFFFQLKLTEMYCISEHIRIIDYLIINGLHLYANNS